ncbi:hypothetical protein NKH18_29060 [Streptomyces sp. M10(2022)]
MLLWVLLLLLLTLVVLGFGFTAHTLLMAAGVTLAVWIIAVAMREPKRQAPQHTQSRVSCPRTLPVGASAGHRVVPGLGHVPGQGHDDTYRPRPVFFLRRRRDDIHA